MGFCFGGCQLSFLFTSKYHSKLYKPFDKELINILANVRLPYNIKEKTLLEESFGIGHGIQLLRLKDLTGEKPSEDVIHRYIQVAKDLPEEVKDKIGVESNFGLEHGRQLLRLNRGAPTCGESTGKGAQMWTSASKRGPVSPL